MFDITTILDTKRAHHIQETCWFCFTNPKLAKHLIVSIGTRTYLALPQRGPMTEDHCLVLPIDHVLSTLQTDEDVWEEIRVSLD
jgi:diadenosine tetraphosphate (Ap4A) HIT family hydrolase